MSQMEVRGPAVESVQAFLDNIVALARDWFPECTPEQGKEKLEKLETQVQRLVKSLIVQAATPGVVEEATEEVYGEVDLTTATESEIMKANEKLAEVCKKKIKAFENNISEEYIQEHPRYLEVMEEINGLFANLCRGQQTEQDEATGEEVGEQEAVDLDAEDEDGAVPGGSQLMIPTMDPITRKPLKDPVMNVECHHVYGKEGILQLLQRSKKVRCPAMGCQNKKFIVKEDLVQDRNLLKQFAASRKKQGQH